LNKQFIPAEFKVPLSLETADFRLRMLTIHDVVKDFDAVMTSVKSLQGVFCEGSKWPEETLTLEQDLIDLAWHQKEFQRRSSFAYTIMALDESRCLGCLYIYPPSRVEVDAEIIFWVRESELQSGLEQKLCETIKKWMQDAWPFITIIYPGRDPLSGVRLKQS
jgi:RimJ/RimL family protein N-acetyltransferase